MPLVPLVVDIIVLLSCAWWIFMTVACIRCMRHVPVLDAIERSDPPRWPRVSLVVPACNEADTLEQAVRTRLADPYPDLEIVLVDDRSTDGTSEIVDRLAAEDRRVRAVHVRTLPDGWLGKVHALHTGQAEASGDWLLFSDADVRFAPGTLRRSVSYAEADRIDHLTALPEFPRSNFWLDTAYASFVRSISALGRLWAVPDPRSRAAVGSGVFNLVRREAFARTPGFEWLRLEIADDVSLGQMLKRHGARAQVVNARGSMSIYFYRSVREMWRGMEKNSFAVLGGFSHLRLLFGVLSMFVIENGIFAGPFAWGAQWWIRALAASTTLVALIGSIAFARWSALRVVPSMFIPVGSSILAVGHLRSAWMAYRRGGIAWRGTLYAIPALRAGARFESPL